MGILQKLGLRRQIIWDKPTWTDEFLDSPLQAIVLRIFLIIVWLRGNPVKPPTGKAPIKIVCLSDTHEGIVRNVPDGDLLIHAGDLTNSGTTHDIQKQLDWLVSLPHAHKVVIAGNHDSWFDRMSRKEADVILNKGPELKGIHYLQNTSITLSFAERRRLTIFGFANIPKCGGDDNAFQYLRREHPWSGRIPMGTDVLRHHLDNGLGCDGLLEDVWRVRPKLHIFGHVHVGRGRQAVFWDDCQRAYEGLASRKTRGPIIDMVPSGRWILALKVLFYGTLSLAWQWIMNGGASEGSLMINAGCQEGNTKRLTRKRPLVVYL
ncbi:Metallo-dependent phosphatase-like protein [Xylariales sp. AK1849]|nr:Metallo-dependent phosphatase-like protein [Xylariales sp. AK1849]